MNPLILLLLTAGLSAGVAFWQQQSIDRVRASSARLSGQLLQTRAALESEQAALASAHAQLKKIEAAIREKKQERATLAIASGRQLPTPEQEGWWPEAKPYFYLAKTYLPTIRFGERQVLMDPKTGKEATSTSPQGQCIWLSDQPFSAEGLNPHLAVLLGMSDEEITTVNDRYAGFVQGVREIEAANVRPVEPPTRDDDDGCMVVARLPVLTDRIQPLAERWELAVRQTVGVERAEILLGQATRYFDQEMGELGAAPRELLINGDNLWVRFEGRFHVHLANPVFVLSLVQSPGREWQYGHLFGPGAPCAVR